MDYGRQRNHVLQILTELEIKISMKASKTQNRFSTTENRFAKKLVLTFLIPSDRTKTSQKARPEETNGLTLQQ